MLTIAQVIRHETVKAAMEGRLQNAQAAASLWMPGARTLLDLHPPACGFFLDNALTSYLN
ncbi:MAG: hypothetical protein JRI97_07440 [Deltaproteobacteria bacterium]|nr:hypothetical protein [Deltaproteobacteria bacterium]